MPAKLQINLRLGRLGWAGLEQRAADMGVEMAAVVADAVAHFCAELDRGRIATDVPRFATEPPDAESRELVIELERDCLGKLDQETVRQGVDLESLFAHATLVLLADGEAGSGEQSDVDRQSTADDAAVARRRQLGG